MNQIETQVCKTPVGELIIGSYGEKLCLCDWKYRKMRISIDKRIRDYLQSDFVDDNSLIITQTINQLKEYFCGSRKQFSVPVLLIGTDFQKKVWDALLEIPYGSKISYMELAERINNPDAIRAVASANGANALSLIIPCHRVIGSHGELVGYAGGIEAKRKILDIENGFSVNI